jgi:hypothetical protein
VEESGFVRKRINDVVVQSFSQFERVIGLPGGFVVALSQPVDTEAKSVGLGRVASMIRDVFDDRFVEVGSCDFSRRVVVGRVI